MKFTYTLTKSSFIITLLLSLFACDHSKDIYEQPPWLGGSIIETLEEKGNYKILLQLIDKAGYKEPIEKGLFTVFAANDSAYQAYFNSKGISSVDDISSDQAFQLFTLNVLNTPRARQQLIFEYSFWHGGWQEPRSEIGALLWRTDTRSVSNDYVDEVKYFKEFKGQSLKILGQAKKVPLLSTEFFSDFNGASDGSDYTYFFPNTKWKGLQWYNASVEAEAKCSNGYIYFLDKAVPEIPSIDEYLRNHKEKFGVYYDLIQRFASYSFNKYDDDTEKTRLYNKNYLSISNIANETGPSQPIYDRRDSWSAFIPTDNVLQDYINNTFLKHFESLDSVPEISLIFLAQSCLKNNFDVASKIKRSFVNNYGDNIPLDVNGDVSEAILLSNGPLYTLNKYYPPKAFTSTVSPVFFDNKYSTFLYALNEAQMVSSLTSTDLEVTIFAPTNSGLLEGGVRYYKEGKRLEYLEEDGSWSIMDFETKKTVVGNHVITDNKIGSQIDFSGEGYVKMTSGNYIYYNNNSIIGGGNQELGNVSKIISSQKGDNGMFYALDNAILAPKNDPAKFIANSEDLSEFNKLLFSSGLAEFTMDSETQIVYPRISFLLTHDFWTVLAPTNEAIIAARNNSQIPDNKDDLKKFLHYFFIPDVVFFDDGKTNGTYPSYRIDTMTVDGTNYTPIEIINTKNNMSIKDWSGNIVNIDHEKANNLVQYGVVHKTDKIILGQ